MFDGRSGRVRDVGDLMAAIWDVQEQQYNTYFVVAAAAALLGRVLQQIERQRALARPCALVLRPDQPLITAGHSARAILRARRPPVAAAHTFSLTSPPHLHRAALLALRSASVLVPQDYWRLR